MSDGTHRPLSVWYVGGAATASAFALAGCATHTPASGEELEAFERARSSADVVLLSNDIAGALPPTALENALVALAPLVAVLHDSDRSPAVPTAADRARRQLGFDT